VKIRILDLAEHDLQAGFYFYEAQQAGVGEYFLDSMYSEMSKAKRPVLESCVNARFASLSSPRAERIAVFKPPSARATPWPLATVVLRTIRHSAMGIPCQQRLICNR